MENMETPTFSIHSFYEQRYFDCDSRGPISKCKQWPRTECNINISMPPNTVLKYILVLVSASIIWP